MNGKGDKRRPHDSKQWDEGWVRIFGKVCSNCKGTGTVENNDDEIVEIEYCGYCNGIGKVEK